MVVVIAERGPQVSGTAYAFLVLSSVAVLLRCYCRAVIVKSFALDDWAALVSWVAFVLYGTFSILGVYHGTGQQSVNIPPAELPVGVMWWWACETAYVISNMFLKFSIGIMLLRIAVAPIHRIIVWTVVGILELYSVFYFLLFVLQCRPSKFFWERFGGSTDGTCLSTDIAVNATYVYSGLTCFVDWTLAIIPIFMVWNLQMNVRTKISVAMILSLGAIASTATIIRIPYVKFLSDEVNFLYSTTGIAIWSTAETGMGLAASSFATLRPLFRDFFARTRLLGGTSSNTRASPWPTANIMSGGYIRSRSHNGGTEQFKLRSDMGGKSTGITTVCASDLEADRDVEMGRGKKSSDVKRSASTVQMNRGGWNTSESVLVDESGDEGEMSMPEWGGGIRKTTVHTQTLTR